jgi:transglutaminase/protease-like cytokinesis protein 3
LINQDEETVLKRKLGTSEGYANILRKLCLAAGINCKVVQGYTKTNGFKTGDPLPRKYSHVWNIVDLD